MECPATASSRTDNRHRGGLLCPRCRFQAAYRCHRTTLADYLISLVRRYPYYCKQCDHRFYHSGMPSWQFKIDAWTSCPQCKSDELERVSKHRVPRTWANFWCRVLSVPSYRCPECRTKFFAIRPRKKDLVKEA